MWRRSPSTSAPSAPRFSPGSAPPTAKSASAPTAPGRAPRPPGEGTNVGYLAGIDVGSRITGYGRYRVLFRHIQITEMTCHGVGARWLFPGTRTVLDIGAMNSRALRLADSGRVAAFRMNDRCASGAGRFLERVAKALEGKLEEVGELALRAQDPQPISSICAVLAESEVINHVTAGASVEDILSGAHFSIAERLVALVRQVGAQLNVSPHSEYAGALGAALLARARWQRLADAVGGARVQSCEAAREEPA